MILMEFLLAPTVPSEPMPQNSALVWPVGAVSISAGTGREVFVTSSTMPTVKLCLGVSAFRFLNTARSWAGVVSLEERPYRPPTMVMGIPLL